MSTPAGSDDGFDVVVSDDGTLTVPAAELARHGVQPGAHLRLVPEQRRVRPKRLLGTLKNTVPAAAIEQLIRGLDESKAERTAYYGESVRDT
jgi:hypothetical protein